MSKKYTVKDWLDCKVAITFNSKEEFERFTEVVKPYGITWRGQESFEWRDNDMSEVLLGFGEGEERIASRHVFFKTYKYTSINFKDLELQLPNKQEIHITTDGIKNTFAVLKENGKVVKKVQAKCHDDDTFDFEIGVSVVIDRLLEKAEESKEYVEVKRQAKKGEYVKIVGNCCDHHFKYGEIVKNIKGTTEFKGSDEFTWFMCPDDYVVLEGYKPTKEDDSKEIKVGDMVKVVHKGNTYSTYNDWFKYAGCEQWKGHFVKGRTPEEECEYKVVFIGEHEDTKRKLYLIQNLYTTQVFIIGKKGVKKV